MGFQSNFPCFFVSPCVEQRALFDVFQNAPDPEPDTSRALAGSRGCPRLVFQNCDGLVSYVGQPHVQATHRTKEVPSGFGIC